MIWTFVPGPGAMVFVGKCDDESEYDRVVSCPDHVLDGQAARVSLDMSDRESLMVRFELARPWRPPTTRITFEDTELAEQIAEVGFHVFEGTLHHVMLVEPGVLMLDRMFSGSPPPQYHGRSWREEDAEVSERVNA